jgi:hypothetical protein
MAAGNGIGAGIIPKIIKDNLNYADLEQGFNESWKSLGGRTNWGGPKVEAADSSGNVNEGQRDG